MISRGRSGACGGICKIFYIRGKKKEFKAPSRRTGDPAGRDGRGTEICRYEFRYHWQRESFANRNEVKELVEKMGGKVTGSVTKKTNYLINNDVESASSKNRKAERTWSADHFRGRVYRTCRGGNRIKKNRGICLNTTEKEDQPMAENDQKDKTVEKVTGGVENTDKKKITKIAMKRSASSVTDRRGVTGKMIDLPNNICVCPDCMQKSFDAMNNMNFGGMDYSQFMNMGPMMGFGDMDAQIPKSQRVKKKKPEEEKNRS